MMDLHRRFDSALRDTVDEWKKRDEVEGIFTYGSVVRGTATANSDLDLVILWKSEEAPARLMAEHKGVLVDMDFIPVTKLGEIFDEIEDHAFTVAGVISRLKGARVEFDREGEVKKWVEKARAYRWPESTMRKVKQVALDELTMAEKYLADEEIVSAVHEMRGGIFGGRLLLPSAISVTVSGC
ncbi:MAG: nucleotidyltransferase domain-containing protein, partial [Candidatus Thorarchaeota archaeon]